VAETCQQSIFAKTSVEDIRNEVNGANAVNYARIVIGRWFLHVGIRVLPPGRAKDEIIEMCETWSEHVHVAVWLDRIRKRGDEAMAELSEAMMRHEAQLKSDSK